MAEGGYFGYDDPDLDEKIDHDSDVHDSDHEQEVDTTTNFQLPPFRWEDTEMKTMPVEQEGLFDLNEGSIDFLQLMGRTVEWLKAKFPRIDLQSINIRKGSGKNSGKVVAIGTRGGEYKILKDDGSGLTKSFFDSFGSKLGPRAEDIIEQDRVTIQDHRRRLEEAENQERLANSLAVEIEKEEQEIEDIRHQIETINARIDMLQETQGDNIESEVELNRLKQLNKNLQKDLDSKKKKNGLA